MRCFIALSITFFVFTTSAKAQYVSIPDVDFRADLIAQFPACFNASQLMDTTCAAIQNNLNISGAYANYDGLQYFKNLDLLFLGNGSGVINIPNFPKGLKKLVLTDMPLVNTLISYPDSMQVLYLSGSVGISNWPTAPATLKKIQYATGTNNVMIPTMPNTLDTLICSDIQLGTLPPLPDSLKYLECTLNNLSAMPSFPSTLKYLDFSDNNLSGAIPVLPEGLEYLNGRQNHINYVPNFPASLKYINLDGTWYLTSLPPLPEGLLYLSVVDANLTTLPPIPKSLTWLDVSDNHTVCLPVIPSGTNGLVISVIDSLTCIPNRPSPPYTLRLTNLINPDFPTIYSSDAFPVCNPVNNSFGCQVFPVMTGHAYNDYNNNGVKDANEPYRANVKVGLSNGLFTMTNSYGYYQIAADNTGSYTLTVTPPNYFTSIPLQYNYNFNTYDTVVTKDFPLQTTGVVDDLSISLLPVNSAARPGFSYPYFVSYTNIGTTTLTPNIVLNYDNTRLNYNSSSNASVIDNGSSLTLAETAMTQGMQKSFTGYFTLKPTAVIGDSLKAKVSIHANAVTVTDSTAVKIRGSYDPNDKSATPSLSTTQVANGDCIYYTIRFQNTGTASAINIVISDSLNGYLLPSTLQVINTSHPARVTVNGDMVYCEFLNINLPDSNVNELASHGFITFKIKPKPTATVGSIIPNKAAIYFDYNTAVITAEAQTTIYDAAPGSHTYTFNGTGNWTTAANWVGGVVPPSTLQAGDHVVINGSCILNIVVMANPGSSVNVVTGKSLFVQGNLVILH